MGELLIEAFKFGLDIDGSAQSTLNSVVSTMNDAAAGSFSVTEVMVSRLASLLITQSSPGFHSPITLSESASRGERFFDARTPRTPFIALLARSIAEQSAVSAFCLRHRSVHD